MDLVRQHIESFPTVHSHNCRKNTNRQFLNSNLRITKMYELYCVKCREDNQEPVKEDIYRQTFNTDYNLSLISSCEERPVWAVFFLIKNKRRKKLYLKRRRQSTKNIYIK